MDMGMTGYQLISLPITSYAADAPVNNNVQVEETSATLLLEFAVPYFAEIIDFGVYITEDFVAQAVDPVVSLKSSLTDGGALTLLKALTLGNSNTNLTIGDGSKDNQTAIAADTDLDNGDVVHANLETVNRKLIPGQVLTIEHTTAASGAGGAYVPFVLLKISGPDFTSDNVWREKRTAEAVGD